MRIDNSWLGSAEGPDGSYIVGSYGTFKIVYTVGKYGIDDGGSIRVARRSGMRPQIDDPKAPGYTTVSSTGDVRIIADSLPVVKTDTEQPELFRSVRGTVRASHIRPFWSAFQIDIKDGSLSEGDKVTFTFGDTSLGSPGIRLKNTREEEYLFNVYVDPFGSGLYRLVPDSPSITIIGEAADQIQIVAPSQVIAGEPFDVTVRVLDNHGNRSDSYRCKVYFSVEDQSTQLPESYRFMESDVGAHRFSGVKLSQSGLQRIIVIDENGLKAASNPIMVLEQEPKLKLFWGDMHGQTKETVGTGSLHEYLSFARDVAALDFTAWQGNDFQVAIPLWKQVKKHIKEYHTPDKFITFLGYEWSGLTPAGGDHNIYYLGDDASIHRSDHWLIEDKSDEETDRYPINKLWDTFRGRKDILAIPHVGGRYGNFDYYDPEFIPIIEVHSNHGTFEWYLLEAVKR